MLTSPEPTAPHTTADFRATADAFGYNYKVLAGSDRDDDILVKGYMGVSRLSAGMTLCASDLTALRDSAHQGELPRSLSIAIMLDGVMADCAFAARDRLLLAPGTGAILSVAEGAMLSGKMMSGQRSRCLMSGGERQRITIARAILKDAPIVLATRRPRPSTRRTKWPSAMAWHACALARR